MAIRKPIVLNKGQLEQLQAGDHLASNPNIVRLINDEPIEVIKGVPMYLSSPDKCKKAIADNIIKTNPIGLCQENIAAATSGPLQTNGTIKNSSTNWNIVVADPNGLVPGAIYFLSDLEAGKITAKAPIIVGHFVIQIGLAISKELFEIRIGTPIKL